MGMTRSTENDVCTCCCVCGSTSGCGLGDDCTDADGTDDGMFVFLLKPLYDLRKKMSVTHGRVLINDIANGEQVY